MAVDNLNYYSSGLPAGQQTDKYTSNPGCLKSKNLDIFSSSKSVKATAWSDPVNTDLSGVVLVDQTGKLIFKNDNIYDITSGDEVLVFSGVSANFPVYKVSYTGSQGTFNDAQRGTPKQLISKYENGVLKYFTIFTDRARFSWSAVEYKTTEETWEGQNFTKNDDVWKKSGNNKTGQLNVRVADTRGMSNSVLKVQAYNPNYATEGTLEISQLKYDKPKYRYNAETDQVENTSLGEGFTSLTITDQLDVVTGKTVSIPIPVIPDTGDVYLYMQLKVVPPEGSTDYTWSSGVVDAWIGNYSYYYNYLPIVDSRYLEEISEYYWEKGSTFQALYDWSGEWENDEYYARVVRYDLQKYMGWTNDISMDVTGMVVWNEQVYMVGNMNGSGYIIPCDLTGGRGTPYIAYGCTFKGVINIDYLLYLVGDDRGVSTLWVFNNQELVPVIGGKQEADSNDIIGVDEQYRFDGKMVNWRKNLILTTTDNRIFQYGQTYGGRGGAFIHQLPENAVITGIKADENDLKISYSITTTSGGVDTTTNYSITYQDDLSIKNYNLEWQATYPIVLGNHLLEKEESDLYVSYILPSSACSLEFRGMANHYHFWTFTSSDNATLSTATDYKLKGATGTYSLKFIERDGDQYTFRLEGDLPHQTANDMQITYGDNVVALNYTSFNHFRKIGAITTTGYQEGEFRFHNLNNKLELPKSHSLQVMVKGKGTADYTPELFALDLVANQRDRG